LCIGRALVIHIQQIACVLEQTQNEKLMLERYFLPKANVVHGEDVGDFFVFEHQRQMVSFTFSRGHCRRGCHLI